MNSIRQNNESAPKTTSISSQNIQTIADPVASLHILNVKNASSTLLTCSNELFATSGATFDVTTSAIHINKPPSVSLSQEEQLEKSLQLITGESQIFFDEAQLRKLKKKDYPEKYYQMELMYSALNTKTSLLRMKLHAAKLIQFECKKRAQHDEKRSINRNLEAFFKHAFPYNKFLAVYQTNNMHVMPNDITLERMHNTDKHANIRRENAKGTCQTAENQYLEFLTMYGIDEIAVATKLHEFLLSKVSPTFIQAFPNLQQDIIERAILRADFTFLKAGEKNAIANSLPTSLIVPEFKLERDPLTQVFWDKLKPEQNLSEREFSRIFSELLYSSFRSDDAVVRNTNRKINAAKRKMDINKAQALKELYKQYSEKCFRESLCTDGFSIIHYTLRVAFYHESIKEFEALEKNQGLGVLTQQKRPRQYINKSEAFKKLNSKISEAYHLGYKAYQKRANIDFDALSEAEKIDIVEALENKITSKIECMQGQGKTDRKQIPEYLPLISYVLQQFKADGRVELSALDDFLENQVSTTIHSQRNPETIVAQNGQSTLGISSATTFEKSVELMPSTLKSKSSLPLVSYKDFLPNCLVTKLDSDPSFIKQCIAVLKEAMANTAEDAFTRTKCEMLLMTLENVSMKAILVQRAEISNKYNAKTCIKLPSVEKLVVLLEYFLVGGLRLVRCFSTTPCVFSAPVVKLILEFFEKGLTSGGFGPLVSLKQKIRLGYTYQGLEDDKIPESKAVERFIRDWGYKKDARKKWKMNPDLTQTDIDGISIMDTEIFCGVLPVAAAKRTVSDSDVDIPSPPQGMSDNVSISLPQIAFQEPARSFSVSSSPPQENAQDLSCETDFTTEIVPQSPNIDEDLEEMLDSVPRIVFPELMRSPEIPLIIPNSDEGVMPLEVFSFEAPSESNSKKTDYDNDQDPEFLMLSSSQLIKSALDEVNEENLMLQECELELENKGNVDELVSVFASLDSLSATGQRSLEDICDFISSDLQRLHQEQETTEPLIDINMRCPKRTAIEASLEDGEFISVKKQVL